MDSRSFLCEDAIIKQRTSSKKQLCKTGEKAVYGNPNSYVFFFFLLNEPNIFLV